MGLRSTRVRTRVGLLRDLCLGLLPLALLDPLGSVDVAVRPADKILFPLGLARELILLLGGRPSPIQDIPRVALWRWRIVVGSIYSVIIARPVRLRFSLGCHPWPRFMTAHVF